MKITISDENGNVRQQFEHKGKFSKQLLNKICRNYDGRLQRFYKDIKHAKFRTNSDSPHVFFVDGS